MQVFTQDSQVLKDFTTKKFKSTVDSNDHLNMSFDLYFLGKKVAVFELDPWSQESRITYIADNAKADIDAYAKKHKLYDALREDYRLLTDECFAPKSAKIVAENKERVESRTFFVEDIITELSNAFHLASEYKKAEAKTKRLCKNSIVIGNKDEFIPLGFKGVKSLEDVLKYKNGRDALDNMFAQAKARVKENEDKGYSILNSQSQLDLLGLK